MNSNTRMEDLLRIYEDCCFLWETERKLGIAKKRHPNFYLNGNTADWRSLRDTLLSIRPYMTEAELVDHMKRHMLVDDALYGTKIAEAPKVMDWVVRSAGYWNWASRRIYTLSDDLQTLLNATSVRGITWSDIHLPFRAFMIALAKPLVWTAENGQMQQKFDTLFVVHQDAGLPQSNYSFWAISPQENYRPMLPGDIREISEMASRKNWFRVEKMLRRRRSGISNTWDGGFTFKVDVGPNSNSLVDSIESVKGRIDGEQCAEILRIVAGMCLYLQSLPSDSPHVTPWQPFGSIANNGQCRVITDPAMVCAVSTQFTLSDHERRTYHEHTRSVMSGSHSTKNPHFRNGYWSRPRGYGQDPTAKKTQWACPTVVNADKLKPGQLPMGAIAMLSGNKPHTQTKPE